MVALRKTNAAVFSQVDPAIAGKAQRGFWTNFSHARFEENKCYAGSEFRAWSGSKSERPASRTRIDSQNIGLELHAGDVLSGQGWARMLGQ